MLIFDLIFQEEDQISWTFHFVSECFPAGSKMTSIHRVKTPIKERS